VKVCVIGTGYVGLVTGAVFAEDHNVVCVDKDAEKIERLTHGQMPFHEPDLPELVLKGWRFPHRLTFSTNLREAVRASEIVFICVGTPSGADGDADLSAVYGVAREIGAAVEQHTTIVIKSTVPVGTADRVREIVAAESVRNGAPFDVVSNPEFLREGSAVEDALHPDRIVIGADRPEAYAPLRKLYFLSMGPEAPIFLTDTRSAELVKYASNAFLATKISFANAMANICDRTGADVVEVMKGVGLDPRIGPAFLGAGLGYGGSCFPKDVDALIHMTPDFDTLGFLQAVKEINRERTWRLMDKVQHRLGYDLTGKRIAVLGLAFKPDTDDMRAARSVEIIERLLFLGATVRAYDPVANAASERALGMRRRVMYCDTPYSATLDAHAAIIVTEWDEIKEMNRQRVRVEMARPLVFDGRNIWEPECMRLLGFEYHSMGRKTVGRAK
jgi:UDPglucose 6-dehydrogenase